MNAWVRAIDRRLIKVVHRGRTDRLAQGLSVAFHSALT